MSFLNNQMKNKTKTQIGYLQNVYDKTIKTTISFLYLPLFIKNHTRTHTNSHKHDTNIRKI